MQEFNDNRIILIGLSLITSSRQGNQQFLKLSSQPKADGINYSLYINIYIFLCMMITKCLHTSYDGTQWFLKLIEPAKSGLNKFYINIYHVLRISNLDKNAWNFFYIFCWYITSEHPNKKLTLLFNASY